MSGHSLGYLKVTQPWTGHAVRFTNNQADPVKSISANSVMAEAIPKTPDQTGNVGLVYICDRPNPSKTTGIGILGILGIPTQNMIPVFADGNPAAAASINAGDYYVEADNVGDGVIASYTR